MGIWSNIKWGLTVQSFSLDRFTGFKGHQNDKRMWSRGHVDWPSEELVHISMVEIFGIFENYHQQNPEKNTVDIFFTQTSTKCKAKARSKDTLKLEWKKLPIHFWNAPNSFISVILENMTKIGLSAIIPSTNGSPHICQTRVGRWHVESCTTHLGSHVCHLRAGLTESQAMAWASLVSNIGYAEKDTNITLEGLLGNAGSRSGYG